MKKIKLSVATLLIAGTSYSQCINDEVKFTCYEAIEMLNTIEEIFFEL